MWRMDQETDSTVQMQRRTNTHLARVVDIGLGYKSGLGYPHAKAYLREQGVPAEIIRRVLSSGGRYRSSENPSDPF